METYLARIAALNDPTRVQILKFLLKHGTSCVCELQHSFDMGQPRLSRHLKILKEADFLDVVREGTKAFYSIAAPDDGIQELLNTITRVQVVLPDKVSLEEIQQLKKETK